MFCCMRGQSSALVNLFLRPSREHCFHVPLPHTPFPLAVLHISDLFVRRTKNTNPHRETHKQKTHITHCLGNCRNEVDICVSGGPIFRSPEYLCAMFLRAFTTSPHFQRHVTMYGLLKIAYTFYGYADFRSIHFLLLLRWHSRARVNAAKRTSAPIYQHYILMMDRPDRTVPPDTRRPKTAQCDPTRNPQARKHARRCRYTGEAQRPAWQASQPAQSASQIQTLFACAAGPSINFHSFVFCVCVCSRSHTMQTHRLLHRPLFHCRCFSSLALILALQSTNSKNSPPLRQTFYTCIRILLLYNAQGDRTKTGWMQSERRGWHRNFASYPLRRNASNLICNMRYNLYRQYILYVVAFVVGVIVAVTARS